MTLLAEALLGVRNEDELAHLLAHFQENRARARQTLNGEQGERVQKLLVSILESRLAIGPGNDLRSRRMTAIDLAAVPLALLRAWLAGTIHCDEAEMARHISTTSATMRKALF